jgi:hypothetical protein
MTNASRIRPALLSLIYRPVPRPSTGLRVELPTRLWRSLNGGMTFGIAPACAFGLPIRDDPLAELTDALSGRPANRHMRV